MHKGIDIAAPIEITFEAVLDQLGPESQMPDGRPFPMKFEQWLHRAMGLILPEHRDGMPEGWEHKLQRIRELAERKKKVAGINTQETKR